jgi:hypothetical protein
MREIGGAVGIAAVTTVLVAGTRDSIELAGPAARQAAAFNGFQSAFIVTVVVAALGALIAGIAFRARQPMPGSPSPRRSRSWLQPPQSLRARIRPTTEELPRWLPAGDDPAEK